EQIVLAGAREHGRLPYRGHRQPAGARPHLALGEVRALVRLVMRADRGLAQAPQLARHVVDVALRRVDVEHQSGRDQLFTPQADGGTVLAPGALASLPQGRPGIQHLLPPRFAQHAGGHSTAGPRQRTTRTGSRSARTRSGRLAGSANVSPRLTGWL